MTLSREVGKMLIFISFLFSVGQVTTTRQIKFFSFYLENQTIQSHFFKWMKKYTFQTTRIHIHSYYFYFIETWVILRWKKSVYSLYIANILLTNLSDTSNKKNSFSEFEFLQQGYSRNLHLPCKIYFPSFSIVLCAQEDWSEWTTLTASITRWLSAGSGQWQALVGDWRMGEKSGQSIHSPTTSAPSCFGRACFPHLTPQSWGKERIS